MRTSVEDLGTGRGSIHMRPQRFFDEEGRVSEVVMVSSEVPPEIIDGIGGEACRKRVAARVERYVALAQAKLRARRAGFMGLEKAKRLSVWHASKHFKERTAGRDAQTRKRVAAASKGRVGAMLDALLEFREQHRKAWLLLRQGLAAVFPPGTWLAWRFYGAARALSGAATPALEAGPVAAPS